MFLLNIPFETRVWLGKCLCSMSAVVVKGKAVPLQALRGPEGFGKLKLPDFVMTAQDGGRLSSLRTGRLYPKEILLVLISIRDWVEGHSAIGKMKNPLTPAGIEPANFRFVAQHLHHCAIAVPGSDCIVIKSIARYLRLSDFVLAEGSYGSLVDRYSRNLVWTLFLWKTPKLHTILISQNRW